MILTNTLRINIKKEYKCFLNKKNYQSNSTKIFRNLLSTKKKVNSIIMKVLEQTTM